MEAPQLPDFFCERCGHPADAKSVAIVVCKTCSWRILVKKERPKPRTVSTD
jgi:DNA-directed RNA polymerase subunit RPC12/RpoP